MHRVYICLTAAVLATGCSTPVPEAATGPPAEPAPAAAPTYYGRVETVEVLSDGVTAVLVTIVAPDPPAPETPANAFKRRALPKLSLRFRAKPAVALEAGQRLSIWSQGPEIETPIPIQYPERVRVDAPAR